MGYLTNDDFNEVLNSRDLLYLKLMLMKLLGINGMYEGIYVEDYPPY